MNKLIMFFGFIFLGCSVLSAIMAGGGGIAATPLTAGIDGDDVTLDVVSTDGYLSTDYVMIEGEKILYTGITDTSFTGCTRGYDGTIPSSHVTGTIVYTASTSAINNIMGFNIGALSDSLGWVAIPAVVVQFFTQTIPRFIMFNWQFLTGDATIIGILFLLSGGVFVATIALTIFSR